MEEPWRNCEGTNSSCLEGTLKELWKELKGHVTWEHKVQFIDPLGKGTEKGT